MLPRFPFTFRKDYGVAAARGIVYTATRGQPGKVAVTWTGNGQHNVTLQYTDAEVASYLDAGAGKRSEMDIYPFAKWHLLTEAPEIDPGIVSLHNLPKVEQPAMSFDGKTFVQKRDGVRLTAQYGRVFDVMKDKEWRSLSDISELTKDPEASISARLRDFRKEKFGAHTVERRHVENGLYEYRLAA